MKTATTSPKPVHPAHVEPGAAVESITPKTTLRANEISQNTHYLLSQTLDVAPASHFDTHERMAETGEPAEVARRQLMLDRLKAIPAWVVGKLREAVSDEAEARRQLSEAEQKRREGIALQMQWDALVEELARLEDRVRRVARLLESRTEEEQRWKQKFFDALGGHEGMAASHALAVVKIRQTQSLYAEGVEFVRSALDAHVRAMREFATKHKLPAEIVAALPS